MGPHVIFLWQKICRQPLVVLSSLLTTIPTRNFYREDRGGLILYNQKNVTYRIRKNITQSARDREFNYRGHSYPRWIVGLSGPISQNRQLCLYHSHTSNRIFPLLPHYQPSLVVCKYSHSLITLRHLFFGNN